MEAFKTNLIELRKLNHLTQRQMAERLGIAQPSYIRYENGKAEPTLENLVKIADIFDVSLDYIFCRTDAPEGRTYNYQPQVSVSPEKEAIYKFLETCFQPGSPNNLKLKESMFRLMEENEP